MRSVFFAFLFLLIFPCWVCAGPGAYKWIENSGYFEHSSKNGSSALVKEIINNSNKKSFLYQIANDTTNLAKEAAKKAGTGSKFGVAGATVKKLVKNGKYGAYGIVGTLIFDLGSDYAKDHWQDYPLLREILCQTLGMCPSDPLGDPRDRKPGDKFQEECGVMQVSNVTHHGPYCYSLSNNRESSYHKCITSGLTYDQIWYECTSNCTSLQHALCLTQISYVPAKDLTVDPEYPDELTPEQEEELSERILKELEDDTTERYRKLIEELHRMIESNPDNLLWDPLDNESIKDSLYQDESDNLQQQKEEIERQLNDDPDNGHLAKLMQ